MASETKKHFLLGKSDELDTAVWICLPGLGPNLDNGEDGLFWGFILTGRAGLGPNEDFCQVDTFWDLKNDESQSQLINLM